MNNIVFIAAAGSGKTTKLVNMAIEKSKTERVLITTYTNENEQEIKKKFYKMNSYIPKNVCILPWFSFLIQHGVKPFQDYINLSFRNIDIKGLVLVNYQSAMYIPEKNTKHYLANNNSIYSDKLSKFVARCNESSNGAVIKRINAIFNNIYIDEIQDLAGYDLEIIKLLFNSTSNIVLAGDPRQTIYLTHHERKNYQYDNGQIINFLNDNKLKFELDTETLNGSYRCNSSICEYASKLYPSFPATVSKCEYGSIKQGVYLIQEKDVDRYLQEYHAVQLRYDIKTKGNQNYQIYNFGNSKGLTFDNVLIYPTEEMRKWIVNHNNILKPTTCSRFYVAITRAKFNVCIIWKGTVPIIDDIKVWSF